MSLCSLYQMSLITTTDCHVTATALTFNTYAEATASQALPYWIGAHQRALAFFGGVPKCIVPDNLKSGVSDPCRYEPGVNRSYQDFAAHYGVAVIPARPRTPRDKAKVEKAVQEVERQILAPLRHQSFSRLSDLNAAIRPLLQRLNERPMATYGLSRRELFEQVEQPALKSLPQYSFVFATWKT
ncbi:IS21 family transposase [Romeria aff. gracilis LEGE 07310]|uniref:IS21 family transposase n=2 Tax=Vasconcelosia TaxID=3366328 RepID=A0A8J7AYF7_9CYAN|nr:IS21 family transposase [Romeria aff. gracilis LEGE 07310]